MLKKVKNLIKIYDFCPLFSIIDPSFYAACGIKSLGPEDSELFAPQAALKETHGSCSWTCILDSSLSAACGAKSLRICLKSIF
jgi:hypothetical protein